MELPFGAFALNADDIVCPDWGSLVRDLIFETPFVGGIWNTRPKAGGTNLNPDSQERGVGTFSTPKNCKESPVVTETCENCEVPTPVEDIRATTDDVELCRGCWRVLYPEAYARRFDEDRPTLQMRWTSESPSPFEFPTEGWPV